MGEPGGERVPAAVDDAVDESLGRVLLVAVERGEQRFPARPLDSEVGRPAQPLRQREDGQRRGLRECQEASRCQQRQDRERGAKAGELQKWAGDARLEGERSRVDGQVDAREQQRAFPVVAAALRDPAAADASSSRSMRMKGQYGAPSTGTTLLRRVARPPRRSVGSGRRAQRELLTPAREWGSRVHPVEMRPRSSARSSARRSGARSPSPGGTTRRRPRSDT